MEPSLLLLRWEEDEARRRQQKAVAVVVEEFDFALVEPDAADTAAAVAEGDELSTGVGRVEVAECDVVVEDAVGAAAPWRLEVASLRARFGTGRRRRRS